MTPHHSSSYSVDKFNVLILLFVRVLVQPYSRTPTTAVCLESWQAKNQPFFAQKELQLTPKRTPTYIIYK
jgi:hypothetical protein